MSDPARQLSLLGELSRCAPDAQSPEEACAAALEILRANPEEFPGAKILLLDEHGELGVPGLGAGDEPAPPDLEAIQQTLRQRKANQTGALTLLPIAGDAEPTPFGILIVGTPTISPPDAARWTFLELAAGQLCAIIRGAQTRAEQVRAHQSKDEFLSTMGHELRTPLSAILGWATMLRRDRRDEAKVERGLSIIERHARAQAGLIDELIDTSRILTGNIQLSPKAVDLNAIVHAAAQVTRPAAEAKGVALAVDLAPAPNLISADGDRLHQVFWNLLSNAIRFSASGQRVEVKSGRSETHALLRVQDSGVGIAREHLPYIFERFWRAEARTAASPGFGLGLSNARHLVEAHGGTVEVESAGRGAGATFTVTLPLGATDDELARAFAVSDVPRKRSARLGGLRVLLVDDDEDATEVTRAILEEEAAQVTCVASAKEAIAAAAQGSFHALVSDIAMPGVDGYMLIKQLREQGLQTPAIALTVYARKQDAELALAAGYQEHFAKPVDGEALIAAIERLTS